MRKKIVAGNWKMNLSIEKGLELTSEIKGMVRDEVDTHIEVVICPTHLHLSPVKALLKRDSMIKLGAQNCHFNESGAFTGEVSPKTLRELECSYVIIGHSERRQYFHEDHKLLRKKLEAVLNAQMFPIYCCGERLEERESGREKEVVQEQITEVLQGLDTNQMLKTVIAYEPVWAIGTGKTASSEQAQEMHAYIRSLVANFYGSEVAEQVSILYGGSVKAGNAKELFAQADIDGGLIGGAALESRSFTNIAKSFSGE